MESILKGPRPSPKPEIETRKEFDPRKETTTYHFLSGLSISEYLPAFSFLRMFEDGGLPFTCGNVSMFSDSVVNSAKWIAPFAPFWSLSSMVRTRKAEETKKWFDRIYVASLTRDEVDHLNHLFMSSLTQDIRHLSSSPLSQTIFSEPIVQIFSELLSRLCFRFTDGQFDQLFSLTTDMYKSEVFRL
jgi:hypothetical protein